MTTTGQFLAALRAEIGKPYVYGATGPGAFDCSGLVVYALNSIGISGVPRVSEDQYRWKSTKAVTRQQLAPGDLVFSQWPGDSSTPGHVAIYTGGGRIIEAAHTGVPVHEIALSTDYLAHVVGYRRITALTGSTSDPPTTAQGSSSGSSSGNSSIIDSITGIGSEFLSLSAFAGKLLLPGTWVRVGAGVMGLLLILMGLMFLTREGSTGD